VSGTENIYGSAVTNTVASGGSQTIQAGGRATGTVVQTGGTETVAVSGMTTSASITGTETVYGSAVSGTVNVGGTQTVMSGAQVTGTTVYGTENVYGSATSDTINSGGTLVLQSGAVASDITVNSGGSIALDGGTLASVNLGIGASIDATTLGFTNGEHVSVSSSGVLTITSADGLSTLATIQLTGNYAGDLFQVASDGSGGTIITNTGIPAELASGTTVSSAVVSAGSPTAVYGSAVDTTITSGGVQQINSGGVASGTQIADGGTQVVSSGGTAVQTVVSSGGTQQIGSGGAASGSVINSGGTEVVQSGGSTVGAFVNAGGTEQVQSGGTMISGTVDGVTDGTVNVYGGTTIANTMEWGSIENVYASGVASASIINSGGAQAVYSGGVAIDTTINSAGSQTILSGGSATSTVVNSGGIEIVASGGTTTSAQVTGSETVSGTAIGTVVNSGGVETVLSGGSASGTTVNAGGTEIVAAGATETGAQIAGSETISGAAINTVLLSGGTETVLAGGSASNTVINEAGTLTVESGGTATNTTIEVLGHLVVDSGGTASGITIDDGGVLVVNSGGTVTDITLNVGGQIDLSSVGYQAGDGYTIDANGVLQLNRHDGSSVDGVVQLQNTIDAIYDIASDGHGGIMLTRAICYLRGTTILTPSGLVNIEDIKIGDRVMTRFGGVQQIRWIGRQTYDAKSIVDNRDQIPVRFRRGSLGDGLPVRDLYISPGHSMLIGGSLIMAKYLVNGVSVTQDWMPDTVDYFQLELSGHDCVLAEGVWSETYADFEGGRAQFHNAADFYAMFPNYREPEELKLCAPRPEKGMALAAALRPIVARAARMATPGKLQGYIERVKGDWKISGWVHDKDHPELPVLVEILLQGKVIGTALACQFREDLLKGRVGQGRAGFEFTSTVKLDSALLATLEVRRASDGAAVRVSSSITDAANNSDTVVVKIAG
jgi:autotransporter passenger strand-loop-strand repeat protein